MTDSGQTGNQAGGGSESAAQQIHVHVAGGGGGGKASWTTIALAVLGLLTAGVTSYATYLNAKLGDLGEAVEQLEAERDTLTGERDRLVTERDELDRQKAALSEAVSDLEKERQTLSAESEQTRQSLEETEAKLGELDRRMAETERRGCRIAQDLRVAAKRVRDTTRKAPDEIVKVRGLPDVFFGPIKKAVQGQLKPLEKLARSMDQESGRIRKEIDGC